MQEAKEKRIKAREEKKVLKERAIQKKIINIEKTKNHIEYQESEFDEEFLDDYHEIEEYRRLDQPSTSFNKSRLKNTAKLSESDSDEDVPLNDLRFSNKGYRVKRYVIVRYEGSYFPGVIDNIHEGQYEISTMVLSKASTYRFLALNTREHATRSWPREKQGMLKCMPATFGGMSLGLVDGHGKCQLQWELQPFELERQIVGYNGYTGNQHALAFSCPRKYCCSQNVSSQFADL
ncbi:unnamed protein product [Diatraea saccharalis]|uniref:Uncharacterized protein n=1 Tax=Diatraea saccharalis TaxID=40085 RepID=A0A9N9N2X7_9NEOP|nr:unnamed protein product [Diatraea saccharalis]